MSGRSGLTKVEMLLTKPERRPQYQSMVIETRVIEIYENRLKELPQTIQAIHECIRRLDIINIYIYIY